MRKQMKNRFFIGLVCVALTVLVLTVPCYAETSSILDELNVSGESKETDADYAEDTVYSLLRGSDLNYGTVKITKISSGQVNVYGLTQCHHICDTVYLSIYLERKVNGVYSTYRSWGDSASDVTRLDKSVNVSVPSGYYYRVSGYHATKNDGRKESYKPNMIMSQYTANENVPKAFQNVVN